jgi:hypothetical protein
MPHARRENPETSFWAAASVTDLTQKQKAVIDILRRLGGEATDETIRNRYEASHDFNEGFPQQSESGLRTRRKELVTRGDIRDSGRKRKLKSGRLAVVWEIVNYR